MPEQRLTFSSTVIRAIRPSTFPSTTGSRSAAPAKAADRNATETAIQHDAERTRFRLKLDMGQTLIGVL